MSLMETHLIAALAAARAAYDCEREDQIAAILEDLSAEREPMGTGPQAPASKEAGR